MFELQVNGEKVSVEQDKTLLSFLRDDLKITSAKDGCSEGACGTCDYQSGCGGCAESIQICRKIRHHCGRPKQAGTGSL